jgi:CubicO group peptidase (beta-lactamase class C family)
MKLKVLCAWLALVGNLAWAGATDCPLAADIQQRIQAGIDSTRVADKLYGITFTVYTDACFLMKGHSGSSTPAGGDISPETTLYRQASISKLFTDLSIAQLIEQGVLTYDTKLMDLTDAPIVQFLWDNETPARLEQWKQITIGQMMSHQAGISKDLPGAAVFGNTSSLKNNSYPTMEDLFKGILDVEFLYPAGNIGTGIKYSNLDLNLLARIVEAYNPEGLKFSQYVKRHVAGPLHMQSFYYDVPEKQRSRMVQGWGSLLKDGTRTQVPQAYYVGSYDGSIGVATTAVDLAQLGMEFLKTLDNKSVLLQDTDLITKLFTMTSHVAPTQGWASGPEWEVLPGQTANDPVWVGHTGTGSSERDIMMVSPELGVGVTMMFNANDANREKYVKMIADLLPKMNIQLSQAAVARVNSARQFLLNTPVVDDPLPVNKADPKELQKFVGSYFADIAGIREITLTDDGYLTYMKHKLDVENLAEGRFRLVPIAGLDAINLTREPMVFEMDANGGVTGIHALQTIHFDRM